MTYYLCKSKEAELSARVEYLKRVFHTLFLRCADEDGFICLKSFPFTDDGICFIIGHDTDAYALLTRGIQAKTVVLNCCFPHKFTGFADKYQLYFCRVDADGFARPRWASEYGTGFDILDSELLLLNNDKPGVMAKIQYAYTIMGGKK